MLNQPEKPVPASFPPIFPRGECMSPGKTSIAMSGAEVGYGASPSVGPCRAFGRPVSRDTEQAAHTATMETRVTLVVRCCTGIGVVGIRRSGRVGSAGGLISIWRPTGCQVMAAGRCAPGLRSCQYGKRDRSFRAGYGGAHGPGRAARIRGPLRRPFRAVVRP